MYTNSLKFYDLDIFLVCQCHHEWAECVCTNLTWCHIFVIFLGSEQLGLYMYFKNLSIVLQKCVFCLIRSAEIIIMHTQCTLRLSLTLIIYIYTILIANTYWYLLFLPFFHTFSQLKNQSKLQLLLSIQSINSDHLFVCLL